MLKHIAISQYAIAEALDIDLSAGMTVITGETGAGKSIMLDALGLCVGDRADSKAVRPGAKRAEVSASFDLSDAPAALAWLRTRDLDSDDEQACILRRTVSADGRSKAFINGTPSTLNDCAELGTLLVDIHSQHAHQSLLRKHTQRALLDDYAGASILAREVADTARQWRELSERYAHLSGLSVEAAARRELLNYQVGELNDLALESNEIARLEEEQKILTNAEYILSTADQVADGCESQLNQLNGLRQLINDPRHGEQRVRNIRELLSSAEIHLEEARAELENYAGQIELNPDRLALIDARLTHIYDLARKHRVLPEALLDHHTKLQGELEAIDGDSTQLGTLQVDITEALSHYQKRSKKLSKARATAAATLAEGVQKTLAQLSMDKCRFSAALTPHLDDKPDLRGAEDVAFLISTNPASPLAPLNRVASGGELSRISLALQVCAANSATSPTMIFDEVDVGIGGAVAEVVGGLLLKLSEGVQILCVTHLPQVAAKGEHHLQVSKSGDDTSVSTHLEPLDVEGRIEEVARMLGGVKLTESTRAHAREMLENSA